MEKNVEDKMAPHSHIPLLPLGRAGAVLCPITAVFEGFADLDVCLFPKARSFRFSGPCYKPRLTEGLDLTGDLLRISSFKTNSHSLYDPSTFSLRFWPRILTTPPLQTHCPHFHFFPASQGLLIPGKETPPLPSLVLRSSVVALTLTVIHC